MKVISLNIKKYCHIKNDKVIVDGNLVFESNDEPNLKSFAKSAYRFLKPSYNKFFKMDEISKLGYIASEFLLKGIDISLYDDSDIAIVLSNSHSTLVTDENHQKSINNNDEFFPSPSIFVYTLPNIMIGEISIRHNFKGENTFFIVENFNADLVVDHVNNLFLTNKMKACVAGWVNYSSSGYEAFLYFASNMGDIPHTSEEVKCLYKKNFR